MVDSIVTNVHFGVFQKQISDEYIYKQEVIDDPKRILNMGYLGVDTLHFILTKAYMNRPDSIKAIPRKDEINEINGISYFGNAKEPYTGPYVHYFLNGTLNITGTFKNGRLSGLVTRYRKNGNISSEYRYKSGLMNGPAKAYYYDGKLNVYKNYKDNYLDGLAKTYFSNCILKEESNYNEYGKDGKQIVYYSTAKIKKIEFYKDGQIQKDEQEKIQKILRNANLDFYRRNYNSAASKISKIIKMEPGITDWYNSRAMYHFYNLKFEKAIEDYTQIIELEPLSSRAYAARGLAMIKQYDIKNSQKRYYREMGIDIFTYEKVIIPEDIKKEVCRDWQKVNQLGSTYLHFKEAYTKNCQ